MKKLVLSYLLCLVSSIMFSQTSSVAGKVNTEHNNSESIQIKIKENGASTNADSRGEYVIKNLSAGKVTLVITALGFETQEIAVELKENEITAVPDIVLAETTNQLQSVEVTGRKKSSYKNDNTFSATKLEMRVIDIPQSISFVTKELIQDQQALRLKDVGKNVAGVNEFSTYDDITIRGFRNNDSNGRLINGLRGVNSFWTSPLLVNIERVEYIKGPASAVFGNSSPGGTINMITKKPLDEARQAIQFTTGSFNTFRTSADFTGPVNDDKTLLYRLNLGYENADTYRDQISNKSIVIAPSISFIPKEGTRFNADLVYTNLNTKLDRGRTIVQGTTDLFATPIGFNIAQPNDYLKSKTLALTLSFSQAINEYLTFNASYLKVRYDEELNEHGFNGYITPTMIAMYFNDRKTIQQGNNLSTYFSSKFKTGDLEHQALAGYDFINGEIDQYQRDAENESGNVSNFDLLNPTYLIRPIETYVFTSSANEISKYYTNGFYVQDLIKYKKIQLLLSLRQEFYTFPENASAGITDGKKTEKALLPKVGLTYSIADNINVYGTYATGFEAQNASIFGNANSGGPFDPMTSNLLEAGSKGEFFNKRLFVGTAVYQITKNNILVSANDASNPDLLEQRGQERARGFEIEAAGRIDNNWSVNLSYAYNDAVITKSTKDDVNNQVGLTKENAPKHISGSWIKYSFTEGKIKGLGLALGHSQVSKRETFVRTLQLPSYVVFNAAAYYKVDRFTIGVNFNNIFDKKYLVGGYNYQRNFTGAPSNFLVNVGYTF
ncbi:iron complex outermembrane receptor protein [Flavobacterium sp. HSC-32F16]|uniref:TonB-dependent receptor n=1 Tax=Flavobacterium sp. HSC-32F16 TaxID=2910964 RepID=UPI0020A3CCEF|nr:TonB-dependent receptor [Flavobacterium sp. HSC-32F16]MCP2028514.1 iron complex outermembrane receptor protein [Flavobacterium sp. HSC-32F16]